MNKAAVRILLHQLGLDLADERALAIANEIGGIGVRLVGTPRPAFDEEPASFLCLARQPGRKGKAG